MPETSPIKKNTVVPLEVEDLAYGGMGVAKPNGFVVFVRRGLPGDHVTARVIKKSKNHAEAVIQTIDRPSPKRIEARCPLFDRCGGCTWQNLAYEEQLKWKHKQVADTLQYLGRVMTLPEIPAIIPSPDPWHYRNKMEYSFGTDDEGRVILGFHVPKRYDQVFAVDRCYIHPEPFDALLTELTAHAREQKLTAYDPRTHRGFLRHAVMRHSATTGKAVLVLVTSPGKLAEPEALAKRLVAVCPELQGLIWGVNGGVADVARIDEVKYAWGDLDLEERVNGLTFKISPTAFFQTNTAAAEKLYQVTLKMADLGENDRVLDAYCGSGTIALHCARHCATVVGIELSGEAIGDARVNAKANGIENSVFLAGQVHEKLELAERAAGGFTRVVIDPPRGGMDKKSLRRLLELRAPVFVYVSCNPSTLARDVQTICATGYDVDAIQPVDMFPHTYHIEVVVRFRLRVE